jgi:hypothetical protein
MPDQVTPMAYGFLFRLIRVRAGRIGGRRQASGQRRRRCSGQSDESGVMRGILKKDGSTMLYRSGPSLLSVDSVVSGRTPGCASIRECH